ncbi:PHD-finger family protein [Coccidioides posadasii C735 delta SOWgp]|uniref:PHD and RING finger domain-containing protein n=2 Tax=Coccidioides posadasii TaxID=199306 RepID=A0A0J6FFY8_COCPO|nr:PHD-finger family protein [Coccidioides posadasii C735 delta SOWgp]EER25202.1 PHD-finger family protein [Coccidioides posadasii C735 delta SOWgp]KMM72066.1 hypothetical protein CPAG_08365 [Coccidioides posadasii RMSCC 3488]|eukprot:XP_003067347.1 PHD-finger family protein [Coccidioides posadasii C735 delta SOWgp]
MSDTCIVCLGDLGEGASDPTLAVDSLPRPTSGDGIAEDVTALLSQTPDRESQYIAHLIPCGHNLHNECLKPWVERANSCPICRQKFNVVELAEHLGGSVISSYAVEDRVQVAEIDPTLIIDDLVDDSDSQPCPICGDDDNEDLLLLCDGCDTASHTYCVGLDSVPSGPWFCCHCEGHRPLQSEPSRPRNRSSRRTRADVRRTRTRNQIQALHWARVWQSVWDHLNLDLDFPFDDEQAADRIIQQRRREAANRREFRTWERRFRQPGRTPTTTRFRTNASDLLEIGRGWPSRPRQRVETPEPESIDEIRAWNAFERAREIQEVPNSNRRKRKSPTASPAEPEQPQPERRLKRPRTRRPEELAELLERGESSRAARPVNSAGSPSTESGPTFLQSLLKEVEDSSGPHRINGTLPNANIPGQCVDSTSPGPSSPALSPASSNRSSPHPSSYTSPQLTNGPTTPISSTSDAALSSPEFSPSCSPARDAAGVDQTRLSRQLRRLQPRRDNNDSSSPSRLRSIESSPTRSELSLHVKSDLQKIVRAALKPHYRKHLVTKEEYTEINKRISRMLYEFAASKESGDPMDAESKARWAHIANNEVMKAVQRIQELKSNEASDSSGAASS